MPAAARSKTAGWGDFRLGEFLGPGSPMRDWNNRGLFALACRGKRRMMSMTLVAQRTPRRRFGFTLLAGVVILAAAIYSLLLNSGWPI